MAGAVADRAWRDAAPDEIEPALAAVWREVGARAPVARAMMSNLVVIRMCQPGEPLDAFAPIHAATIDEVAGKHPSRVIVVAHEGGALARAPMAARVGVATYGPPESRYAIEQVYVRSSCDEASLPSIVRRLVRGDLPTTIWCPGDLSQQGPIRALVGEGRQLLYDSRGWKDPFAGFRVVAGSIRGFEIDVADLNWRRLAPVRRALLHAADQLAIDDLRLARLRITCGPADAALAALLRGWLAARFGWLDANAVRAEQIATGSRLTLSIGDAASGWSLALSDEDVSVHPHGRPPYTLAVPRESTSDAVAAELRTLVADAALRETVELLARSTASKSL